MEGGTLGDLYSLVDLKYDNNNAIYVDEEGNLPTQSIEDVKKFIKLGSVLPDANMSWRNDFRWKNLNFGFMVSARLGGIVFSRTQATLDYFGVSEATAAARDRGGVLINGRDMIRRQRLVFGRGPAAIPCPSSTPTRRPTSVCRRLRSATRSPANGCATSARSPYPS